MEMCPAPCDGAIVFMRMADRIIVMLTVGGPPVREPEYAEYMMSVDAEVFSPGYGCIDHH